MLIANFKSEIPGGCGPKPGPAPTQPSTRPKSCEPKDYTKVTERFVFCTEGFAVSELPSSLRVPRTSSTLQSSLCATMFEATLTVCPGALGDMFSTTTRTGTTTLSSDGPACTRAPLSLDDDEGSNDVNDPWTSITFSSNTTSVPSSTRHAPTMPPSIPLVTSMSNTWSLPMSMSMGTSMLFTPSLGTSIIATSTSKPQPSSAPGAMDRNGMWKLNATMLMERQYSEFRWTLFDPNGFEAGSNGYGADNLDRIFNVIESQHRPVQHSMLYSINATVTDPRDYLKARTSFLINQQAKGCELYSDGLPCKVHFKTEDYTEENKFEVESCYNHCKPKGTKGPVLPSDFWCDDLNDAPWYKFNAGWKRTFQCGFKGF